MPQILVVDDDRRIRAWLCNLLERQIPGVRVAQAENGRRAVEVACSQPPDLILTDIKMPLCTGIELLEKLRMLEIACSVVVVSGYDDFDLVRSAMKLGAADYLLKPVQEEELLEAVQRCLQKAKGRDSQVLYTVEEVRLVSKNILAQQHSLRQLLGGEPSRIELHGPDSPCYLLLVDAFRQLAYTDAEKELLFLEFQKVAGQLFGSDFTLLQGEERKVWAILLIGRPGRELPSISPLRDYLDQRYVKYAALAKPWRLSQLPLALAQCSIDLDNLFYDFSGRPLSETAVSYPYAETFRQMLDAICDYNFEAFAEGLSLVFALASAQKPPVEHFRQLLVDFVYDVMKRNSSFIEVISKYKFTESDLSHVIRRESSATRLRKAILDIVHLYIHEVVESLSSRDSYTVQKAKSIIESQLGKDVSLSMVAEQLELHPNYFSVLFKNKTGMTYRQYVRQLRIEKACELLKNSNLKLYQIEERLGFKDHAHFYRTFKELTGVSPSQYKQELDV